jgi:NTP pyrophosphatase (non-canonical NTP hydrolase)
MTDHQKLVRNLLKPDAEIYQSLAPGDCNLLHMAMGISGEAGELLDAVKKYVFYRKPFDYENAIEELGDLEFYLEGLRAQLGIDRETVLDHNIKKLSKRYGEKYSNEAAIARKDKNE